MVQKKEIKVSDIKGKGEEKEIVTGKRVVVRHFHGVVGWAEGIPKFESSA